ncbi:MAG: hypothetical protein FJZ78_07080 [Bacteroidetes bacterium]|nr:hypothetical protein [Bacteroidota bacterium]
MRAHYFILLLLVGLGSTSYAQKVSVNPVISPAVFGPNDQITVTYDVTGTTLANLNNAWIWVWIPNKSIDSRYNINPATSTADPAKFTKSTANSKVTWSITFKPADFFVSSIAAEKSLGMLIKANDWSFGQSTDYIASLGYQITLKEPQSTSVFLKSGQSLSVMAESPVPADFKFFLNNTQIQASTNTTTFQTLVAVPDAPISGSIKITATTTAGNATAETLISYVVGKDSPLQPKPKDIQPGINYHSDPSRVTLCLQAPGKSSAYVISDLSDWQATEDYIMKRDGEFFWIELAGIQPLTEYAFQYLVDGGLKMADPYADKILDPDDRLIPAANYPSLKSFPAKALNSEWYYNRVSIFQTNKPRFEWKYDKYQRPDKNALVIYELLIRDFFGSTGRTYKNLIDTIGYFKRLGVNAVQLMPVMEFNGNDSWGYNPTFMFAPDKYYGPAEKLKEFIDRCHANGIAVIMDIAMNHQDLPNPMVMLDFDFKKFAPTASNKWFNVSATHPFSVFYDLNHESAYTKAYLDTVNHYWLKEFHIDGYRFDLSKGFTQTSNPNNVSAWGNYDASRINLLKRMSDKIWSHSPNAWIILEHLSENQEEKVLAEYRSEEGKGMMLWGKMTDAYNQVTMGYSENSAVAGVYHSARGWNVLNLVGYMESHDEERLMYKNLTFGNSKDGYNIKDPEVSLRRMKSISNFFYLVPGPKMLWQFGELGFDYSINRCENGSINPPGSDGGDGDCRLSPKPPGWDFKNDYYRMGLFNHAADLIRLKKLFSVFQDGVAEFKNDGLTKVLSIKNKNYSDQPADASQMNAVIAGNFELTAKGIDINFPHSGSWYEYYSGKKFDVKSNSVTLNLQPGDVFLFTDVTIDYPLITGSEETFPIGFNQPYPNPADDFVFLPFDSEVVQAISVQGKTFVLERSEDKSWNTTPLPTGLYLIRGVMDGKMRSLKLIKGHNR